MGGFVSSAGASPAVNQHENPFRNAVEKVLWEKELEYIEGCHGTFTLAEMIKTLCDKFGHDHSRANRIYNLWQRTDMM